MVRKFPSPDCDANRQEGADVTKRVRPLPSVEHTDNGTRVTVTMQTPEVDPWLGRTLDRLVLPRQLERDLHRSLDNLEDLVTFELRAASP